MNSSSITRYESNGEEWPMVEVMVVASFCQRNTTCSTPKSISPRPFIVSGAAVSGSVSWMLLSPTIPQKRNEGTGGLLLYPTKFLVETPQRQTELWVERIEMRGERGKWMLEWRGVKERERKKTHRLSGLFSVIGHFSPSGLSLPVGNGYTFRKKKKKNAAAAAVVSTRTPIGSLVFCLFAYLTFIAI